MARNLCSINNNARQLTEYSYDSALDSTHLKPLSVIDGYESFWHNVDCDFDNNVQLKLKLAQSVMFKNQVK